MQADDLLAFAENFLHQYGATADLRASRLAEDFSRFGDRQNADAWFSITDKVRELQNRQNINRNG